ncbi:thiamine phosphate synthase [uncultured Phascolarctobacterium sp.]|uniref:thiamine phosphate synthase n=1 Tax=uncultured Phascolarctobacterium sp. TaxID=512296 RepID=UPI0025F46F07|nr:thiamine phosphate synthase [uncultured Phascolarctobacterium sp.]
MSELPLIAVTDSATCSRPLTEQIDRLAKLTELRPQAVILRAKSLDKASYRTLTLEVQQICKAAGIPLILHSDWQLAHEFGIQNLHLPLALLRQMPACERTYFTWLSTSVHSAEEAIEAQALGATMLIAGHIYTTQCKADLAPRGLGFLQAVCNAVSLPVYAIGGIGFDAAQHAELLANGARGACVMSAYMRL